MFSPAVTALLVISFAPAPLEKPSPACYLGIDAKPGDRGIAVEVVYIASPAEEAGLQQTDVILSIDGRTVTSIGELNTALRKTKPNTTVSLVVRRQGEEMRLSAKLLPRRNFPYLGLSLSTTTVEEMPPDSPCRAAGILSGDVLVKIAGKDVKTRTQVVAAIGDKRAGEVIDVVVNREGTEKTIQVKLGTRPGY